MARVVACSRVALLVFLVLVALASAACGAESDSRAAPESRTDETCYPPAGPVAEVPECGASELCLAPDLDLAIDSSTCTAEVCRFTYQENLGPTLTYEDGSTFVFLRFLAPIGGAPTTDDLVAAFDHVNFYISFPVKGIDDDAIYFEQRVGSDAFEIFELANGRLHVKLAFTVTRPYAWVYNSEHPSCFSDDILGTCTCEYDVPNPTASIEVDLPAEIP